MKTNRDYTGLERTPTSLAWLIKERASVRGLLEKRKKQLTSLPLEICDLLDRMTSLDSVIRPHEVKLEPSAIEGRRTHEARVYPNCRLKPAVLRFLNEAGGSPHGRHEIFRLAPKRLAEPIGRLVQFLDGIAGTPTTDHAAGQ